MRYVGNGSVVSFKRQKSKVVGSEKVNDCSHSILELANGERVSVPLVDIMWNGSAFLVKANGVRIAESIKEVDKVLHEIGEEMKMRYTENPKARKEAIDACFMEWLRNSSHIHDDKDLGFIVRQVVSQLNEL